MNSKKGLVITGGEGPAPIVCRFLAHDADIIVAADSGLEAAERAGIRPSWITGDMDSIDCQERLEKYPAAMVSRFPRDKDYTDTELALNYLWDNGCAEICVAGGGGGRLDHLLAIFTLFERERFPVRWVTASEDARCLDASCPGSANEAALKMELPLDSIVSVFPIGSGDWQAESAGLKRPLNSPMWNRGLFGISNRTDETHFSIRVIRGRFLIVLPLI